MLAETDASDDTKNKITFKKAIKIKLTCLQSIRSRNDASIKITLCSRIIKLVTCASANIIEPIISIVIFTLFGLCLKNCEVVSGLAVDSIGIILEENRLNYVD